MHWRECIEDSLLNFLLLGITDIDTFEQLRVDFIQFLLLEHLLNFCIDSS